MRSLKLIFAALILFSITACQNEKKPINNPKMKLDYPQTVEEDVVDNYFGTEVKDPYRWLEIDTAANVKDWVSAQNKVTQSYLKQIPYIQKIADRYEELFNFPKMSAPNIAGDYYFYSRNDGLQNQAVLYYKKGKKGEEMVFIDPNKLSEGGTVAINITSFSNDYKYVAYTESAAGSDWSKIKVREIETNKETGDVMEWVKFSGAAWFNDGFFYSRYPAPKKGMELSAANKFHAVYYHKMGDDQSKDKLIYENKEAPRMYHWCNVTEDDKYLVLYAATGTDGYECYVSSLENGVDHIDFKALFSGFDHKSTIIDHDKDHFLVYTNIDAPKYRLVNISTSNFEKNQWRDIIPERDNFLSAVNTGGGKLFATYLQDATNKIFQMDYDGQNVKEISLPGIGSVGGFSGYKDDKTLFYTYTSFIYPNTIFEYDISTGKSELFNKLALKFNPDDYVEKQIFYTSKDGTKVPMFIVHKKELILDGNNPTYLYGYGGFSINLSPYFSTSRLILLENGGVFALPNLRGGGEYGEEWHKAGMLKNKQNVFDDFMGAAEYLINEKYTSSAKLGIAGGSNGGLLVGACMTQRPELFSVAFPAVGVMDMLRYHKFTVGWGWVPEYGSSEDSTMFSTLYAYSPLHNLQANTCYPATMVTTSDHDDRVVPAHSFKFAATLQKYNICDNPALISIAVNAGHGAGKPTSKIIEEQSDMWAFFFYNTNSGVKY